jgi:hypothetical protein
MHRFISRIIIFTVLLLPVMSRADVLFSGSVAATLSPCKDYFTAEWASPLNMNNQSAHGDILYNIATTAEINQLTKPSYSSGSVSMTATGDNPYFRLLTPASTGQIIERDVTRYGDAHPIDPTEYSLLTFRMFSTAESQYSVRWDKSAGNGLALTSPASTYAGWRTYQINLPTATLQSGGATWNNGNNYGLAIYPLIFGSGETVFVDWLQLTPPAASCATFGASYSANSGEAVSIFVDDLGDTNPNDDYQAREAPTLYTGGTTTRNWNSTLFYPGSYNVFGFASPDFATHTLNPWDFSSTADIRLTAGVTGGSISNGKYCGTAGAGGAQIYFNIPYASSLDTSVFKKISVGYEGGAGVIRAGWISNNGAASGARHVTVAGNGVYQIDLSGDNGFPGNVGSWTGTIDGSRVQDHVRIDLVGGITNFCIDWVSIGTEFANSQPAAPNIITAPGTVTIDERYTAPILMPDNAGGVDYFTSQQSNPATLDDSGDIDEIFNVESALLCPGKSYVDNLGVTQVGDYVTSENTQTGGSTDGDPQFFAVLREEAHPIDPNYFKIGCTTMALPNVSPNVDHTVLRFGWETAQSGTITGYTGDDIVLRTVGETRYCARMENMPIEVNNTTINGNFWLSPLNSFRIDPHERAGATTTVLSDIRLAADHEADGQFAIVVGGDRAPQVSIYKNTTESTSGGILIGTLAAGRNTDVFLWNTTAETTGALYYIYSTVAGNSALAPGPVKINHSTSDTTPPVLLVDAPAADGSGRYSTLDVAGWSADNVRLANIEVFIDNIISDSFIPSGYQHDRKTAYASLPYASKGGFQRSVAIAGLGDGSHTFRIDAYDTAGNRAQYSTTFTKTSTSLTSNVSYSIPNETCQSLSVVPPVTPGSGLALTTTLNKADINFAISGMESCSKARIMTASDMGFTKNVSPIWSTASASDLAGSSATVKVLSAPRTKLVSTSAGKKKKVKPVTKAYIRADCGEGVGATSVYTIDTKKTGNGKKKVASVVQWIKKVKGKGVKQ